MLLLSCQQDYNSSREALQAELNIDDDRWENAFEAIKTYKDQKFYFWDEEQLKTWEGEKELTQLIAIRKEKSLIILDLWDRRNEEWQSEQLVYKNETSMSLLQNSEF